MENNKIELNIVQILIIILCSGIISIILFFSGFYIINPTIKKDIEVTKVNENTTLEKLKVDSLKNVAERMPTPPISPTPPSSPTPPFSTPQVSPTPPSTDTTDDNIDYNSLPTLQEVYKDQNLQKSESFVISAYYSAQDSDKYTLYIHTLEDKPKKISKEELDTLSNGGIIKFRGCNWFLMRKRIYIK